MRAIDPDVVIVVITGYATISTAVDAMKAGAYDFLPKPFTPDELRLIVNRGHERWRLAMESERLRREKEEAERRFVTFVSHQLKSPLVAAKQYLDVLLFTSKGEHDAQDARSGSRARRRGSTRCSASSTTGSTLARVERGTPGEPDAAVGSCGVVVAGRWRPRAPQAQAAGVTVDDRAWSGRRRRVRGRRVSLGTIVSNLVSNAIKYNRAGGTVHGSRRRATATRRCSR